MVEIARDERDRDDKVLEVHQLENFDKDRKRVADVDAADYVDPTVIISDEENRRLRKIIYKRWDYGWVAKLISVYFRCYVLDTSLKLSTRVPSAQPLSWAGSRMSELKGRTML